MLNGNSGSTAPIYFEFRYQQVYDASTFLPVMPQGAVISQVSFRLNESLVGTSDVLIPSIQIRLSTTTKAVNSLSPVFGENAGGDETVVFGPRGIDFAGTAGQFAFMFPLDTAFFFDPRQGNLLLEARNFSQSTIVGSIGLDAVSNSLSSSVYDFSASAVSGTPEWKGLVTEFTFTAVPEPSGVTLFAAAAVIVLACRRRLRRER